MAGRTEFITQAAWADILLIWFVLIDDAYQALVDRHGAWRRCGPPPRFSDSEVITVALFIATFFHGHEALGLACLRQHYRALFPHLPASDGCFNARRRRLGTLIEQVRQHLLAQEQLLCGEPGALRLIDSAPVALMTYARGHECQTVAGADFVGYVPSHKAHFFGMRLVCLCTTDQQVDSWLLAPARLHDSETAHALLECRGELVALGDGSYHSPGLARILADNHAIELKAPPRSGAKAAWSAEKRTAHTRTRRAIESVFATLSVVFHCQQPGSRSLDGLVARISSCILAYSLCFVMQRYLDALPT
jgi:hypothetical protein